MTLTYDEWCQQFQELVTEYIALELELNEEDKKKLAEIAFPIPDFDIKSIFPIEELPSKDYPLLNHNHPSGIYVRPKS